MCKNNQDTEPSPVLTYSTAINNSNKTVEKIGDISYTEIDEKVENDAVNGTTTVSTSVNFDDNTKYSYDTVSRSDYFGRNEMDKFSMLYDYDEGYELYYGTETEFGYKDIPAEETGQPDTTTSLVNSYKNSLCFDFVVIDESKIEEELFEGDRLVVQEYEYLYEYDSNSNITRVSLKALNDLNIETVTEIQSYVYDNVGQLVRENNAELNKTFTYVYDKGGNIARKSEYAYTTGDLGDALSTVNYTYDSIWKDKLTAYGNTQIQTDSMGNPLNYVSKTVFGEDVSGTLEWSGRQLAAVNQDNKRYEYSYNSDGLRTSVKTYINNVLTSIQYYIWKNGKLMGYFNEDKISDNDTTVKMLYDNNDELIGFRLVNEQIRYDKILFFRKNLQGDILSVCDSFGNQVLTYTYDAWGNVNVTANTDDTQSAVSASMAIEFVPITYRGYLYDSNTGLYYLQSRYYNPTYGRFLNADSIMKTGEPLGANIFAYCKNNPVNYVDYDGKDAMSVITKILYLLVVVAVMEADDLLEDFGYIFEGATSVTFRLLKYDDEVMVLEAYFIHNIVNDFRIYTVSIDIIAINAVISAVDNLMFDYVENDVVDIVLGGLMGLFFEIPQEVEEISVFEEVRDKIQNYNIISFLRTKRDQALLSGEQYVVFVDMITMHYTTIFGNTKKKTIYSCYQ